jgi:alanyl-tRNA synthetase
MKDPLYYTDSYLWSFQSRVIHREERGNLTVITLEDTAFYPESGGQPADRGRIGSADVVDVQLENQVIVHLLRGAVPGKETEVECLVDGRRRFDHMQQHSGQHLLSGCFLHLLQAQTLSFHLGEEESTLDLSLENLEDAEIERVEELAQEVIEEDRPIRVRFAEADDLEEGALRKAPQRTGRLRLVEIADFDSSACGGTHCGRTGEIGLVKITGWERIRGNVRVRFLCGRRAQSDYRRRFQVLRDASGLLSADWKKLGERVAAQLDEIRRLKKERERLSDLLLENQAEQIAEQAESVGSFELLPSIQPGREARELNRLAGLLLQGVSARVVLLAGVTDRVFLVFARTEEPADLNLGSLAREAAARLGGRGGGPPDRGQGGGPQVEAAEEALAWAEGEVRRVRGG